MGAWPYLTARNT
ncbi:hypothetical protein YPPY13_1170, partial [Yersinia pestis PY-13]